MLVASSMPEPDTQARWALAYRAGRDAHRNGQGRHECPYFGRSQREAWEGGFDLSAEIAVDNE